MTVQETVLLIVFILFLSGCGIYIARVTKRQKSHRGISPERSMELEEDQVRVEDGPSRR